MDNTVLNIMATPRIKRLREEIVNTKPSVCSERALIVTKSYMETEGQPMPIRRAKALKKVLDEMTIHIWDGELIVGMHSSRRRGGPVFPEWGSYWLERELDDIEKRPQDSMMVSEQVKEDLRSIFPYWRGRTVYDRVWGTLPEEVKKARTAYVFTVDLYERGSFGHMIYDTPRILAEGFSGVKKEVAEKISNADISKPEQFEQVVFWQAVEIVCDGIIGHARRYAREARRQAANAEVGTKRREELERIAEVCERVPEYPARNLWEAIQTAWFLQMIIQIEGNGNSVSMGRLDQHFYPYFQQDYSQNKITLAQAQELLDCLWTKVNEIVKVWDTEATRVHAGFPMTQNVIIGGQNEEGVDATNELTYLFLNTQEHIRLGSPQFTMRVHSGTPQDLLTRACEVIKGGGGMPALFGDDAVIQSLLHLDIPLKEARNYGMVGCVEPSVIGAFGRNNGGYFNLARVIDMALNNGVDRLTGAQLGPQTGTAENLDTFEKVLDAAKAQMAYFVRLLAIEDSIIDRIQAEVTPHVFASAIIPGCIEKGKDITAGGARYHWTPPFGAGLATAADSLAAVKKVVFEERKMSLSQLNDVLDQDFSGMDGEIKRRMLLKAPKYGNDDAAADEMAKFASDIFFHEVEKYPTGRGGHMVGGLFTLSATVPHGWKTGATADGRKARTPISDSISPTNGADKSGPTSVLLSASRLDHGRCSGGNVLNIKFSPGALESSGSLDKFSNLLKTYLVDLHGFEVQINVVSAKTLRAAQHEPDKYRDLIIRVAGYSARFVELAKDIQEDIISRTEQDAV